MNFYFASAKKFWLSSLSFIFLASLCLAAPRVSVTPSPSWTMPVTPGGKPASAKDFSDGYYVLFLDKQVHLQKKTSFFRTIRQIATESGIQNGSEISVTFDPSYEEVEFHSIIIWRDGKPISQLRAADFKVMPVETDRQRFIYDGSFSATLILKDIRKGDKIEYSYSIKGWNSVFQNKYSSNFSFGAYDYITHTHYAVMAEKGRFLSFRDFNKPPVKTIKEVGGATVYEWELKNIKAVEAEDFTPSWYYNYPFVQITEFKNWKDVVDWGLQFYQIPVLSGKLAAKTAEWKKASKTDLDYIGLATRFVQDEIRYLGIETGANSHRPHTPEEVFNQRYGDCKDKAFLLCALLKANNIDANPLLVNTYKRNHLSEYLPTPADFNHVVVHVAVGEIRKDFILIDATSALQGGAASQISFPNYGEGLLLKSGQKDLIPLMLHKPGSVSVTEEIKVPLVSDTSGTGILMVKTVYFDAEADYIRGEFQQNNFSETEKNYLNYYRDIYKHAEFERVDSLEFYDQREANNISLVERYAMKNGWQYDSTRKKYYFRLVGKMLYNQLVNLLNRPRNNPVSLYYPYHMDYKIRAALPDRRVISAEKWDIKRDAYEIHFSSEYNVPENAWELHYEYQTLKDHVAVKDIAQFRKDMEKLIDNLEYELTDDGSPVSSSADLNYPMIVFSILVVAGAILFCRQLYKFSPAPERNPASETKLGGWVAFLGLSVVVQPLALLVSFLTGSELIYHVDGGWNVFSTQGDLKNMSFHVLLATETCVNIYLICFSIFLGVLYFQRRTSFPLLFSIFIAAHLFIVVADNVVTHIFFLGEKKLESSLAVDLFRQIVFAAIWIPYVNKSERVKRTFVNSYRKQKHSDISEEVV